MVLKIKQLILVGFGVGGLTLLAAKMQAGDVAPGQLRDVAGLQMVFRIAYNSVDDQYLVGYSNQTNALVAVVDTDGNIGSQIVASTGNPGVHSMDLAYNPDENEFFYVYRSSTTQTIYGRFLDGDGNPITDQYVMGSGNKPHVAYSPASDVGDTHGRFVFTHPTTSLNAIEYKVVDGDSSNTNPLLTYGTIIYGGLKDQIAYGADAQKFMVVYAKETSDNNIYGKFISADGTTVSSQFTIDDSTANQNGPILGYARNINSWICAYQTWEANPPDAKASVISSDGSVTSQFWVANNGSAWEVPGAIVYNDVSETVLFGWRHADNDSDARVREWTPGVGGGSWTGSEIVMTNKDADVQDGAARTNADDPDFFMVWRNWLGADGVYASKFDATAPALDVTPPAALTDLGGITGGSGTLVSATAIAATDEQSGQEKENTTDTNNSTFWGTNKDDVLETESITWSLGSARDIKRVVLRARDEGLNYFPLDYEIQVSADNVTYSTAYSVSNANVPIGTSADHVFSTTATDTEYVRLLVTNLNNPAGKYKVSLGDVLIYEDDSTAGVITVTWTAPGDDGNEGTAASYALKWSTSTITDANFDSATDVASMPTPQVAGTSQEVDTDALPDESTVYLALKTTDEASNVSDISNIVSFTTPGVAPDPVDDLVASNPGGTTADLTWTATGDDGSTGTATSYDLRWSLSAIDDSNFSSATSIDVTGLTPGASGTAESFTATGLPAETTVYFGIKVLDDVSNESTADTTATEPSVTTLDQTAPDAITDLSATASGGETLLSISAADSSGDVGSGRGKEEAVDGNVATYWGTPVLPGASGAYITVDAGSDYSISQVRLLSRSAGAFFPKAVSIQTSSDNVSFTTVDSFTDLAVTPSTWHTLDITPTTGRYVKILVTEARQGANYRVQIADIEVYKAAVGSDEIALSWTAPGDNGDVGTATSYDLRWSTSTITASNFSSATSFSISAPLAGGSSESALVTGLAAEATYYFAIQTSDEVPNVSYISNIEDATIPGVAPDAVNDFQASGATGTTVDLSWTSTGDDADTGTASSYDVRYSTAAISASNFDSATSIVTDVPTPSSAGTAEGFTVTGLNDDTTYYFAIKVLDDVGNTSAIHSNGNVTATTLDGTSPEQTTALTAEAASSTLTLTSPTAVGVSSELNGQRVKGRAVDGDENTFWSSLKRTTMTAEHITLDLGAATMTSRVRLLERSGYNAFPEDVQIQVSAQSDTGFTTVVEETNITSTPGLWHTFDYASTSARYIRVNIPQTRLNAGDKYFTQIMEIEVYEADPPGSVTLSWPSPGDDPGLGTPTSYDVRYSTSEITNDSEFDSATSLSDEPTPQSYGSTEAMNFVPENEGVLVYFALKSSDEAGNTSSLSNDASITTTVVAPSAVSDLAVDYSTSSTAKLTWTATGDNYMSGTATRFDVRMSTSTITAENFASATEVSGEPTPEVSGTEQSVIITSLSNSTTYYFAMKVEDETAASSDLSNVVSATTDAPDTTAPSAVTDLRGGPPTTVAQISASAVDASGELSSQFSDDLATDDDVSTWWTSPSRVVQQDEYITMDLGSSTVISRVRIRSRSGGALFPQALQIQVSDTENSGFSTVHEETDLPVTAGLWHEFDFTAATGRYVRVNMTQMRQHWGKYRAQVAEIEVYEATFIGGSTTVAWTAPGDDGNEGTAASYALKWSTSTITDANFDSATDVASMPTPQVAGTSQEVDTDALPDESTVYLALKTTDEASNVSDISNIVSFTTPGVAPDPVDDLVASNPGGTTADLTWTATGDDGSTGTATSYDLRWSLSAIDDSNFSSATSIDVTGLTPGASGTAESFTATGLPAETTVYFGIKVLDDVSNESTADTTATEPSVTTLDQTAPDAITDLSATASGGETLLSISAADSSGDVGSGRGKEEAVDGNVATYWGTPVLPGASGAYITVDAGSDYSISQVRLLSRSAGAFFPKAVSIQTSSDNVSFTTVDSFTDLAVTPSTWHTLDITPTTGRYVKILVTEARQGANYRVQIADIEVYKAAVGSDEIALSWTAPGDNGDVGTATSYDLRWSTSTITASNFSSATSFSISAPLAGGSSESALVTGLAAEATYYFAIQTSDEVPNVSYISNIEDATIPGVAPDAVNDFQASGATGTTVDLSWTSTGDDADTGTASSYDVRYSTAAISASNFDSATSIVTDVPTPSSAGTAEGFTVTGLNDDTTYYFAIKVLDDVGNTSAIHSNGNVTATTLDGTSPEQTTALTAEAASSTLTLTSPTAVGVSSELNGQRVKGRAVDGDENTFWSSLKRTTMTAEHITLDLGAATMTSRVRLLERSGYNAFPEDVQIQVSAQSDTGFTTVVEETNITSTPGLWHTFDYASTSARYIRVNIPQTRLNAGDKYFTQIMEIEVYEADPPGSVTLSWPSPGDDPGLGTPTSYDVRYSTSEITNDSEFDSATSLSDEPTPQSYGSTEAMNFVPENEGVLVYFALKSSDEAGNTSSLSNDASITTTVVAPSAVSDLAVDYSTSSTAKLTWTATGDNYMSGTATRFDVRMSTSTITAENFASATEVSGEPTPEVSGTEQSVIITSLSNSTTYYFAMKVEDETAASSDLSNVVSATTDAPDTTAPSAVTDLRGGPPTTVAQISASAVDASGELSSQFSDDLATDDDVSTWWTSPSRVVQQDEYITMDLGSSTVISRVRIRSRSGGALFPQALQIQVSDTENSGFSTVHEETDLPVTAGLWHEFDFTAATGRYVRVNMTQMRQHWGKYRAQVAEIEVYEATFVAGSITLNWTAPGDDASIGMASSYDLRWSLSPIDAGNFNSANPLAPDAPSTAGTVETIVLDGLQTGVDIYFAIKAADEASNTGDISNVIQVTNPSP